MPDDKSVGVTIEEYEKDKDEFADSVDILLAADDELSDDDLEKELDKKLGPEAGTAGEATKDQPNETEGKPKPAEDNIFTEGQDPAPPADPATDPDKDDPEDTTDWKAKAAELEAELQRERQKTSSWDGRIKAANQKTAEVQKELDELKLAKEKAPDPDAESDKEVLDRFRTDFPELADVVDVLDKRITKSQPKKEAVPVADAEADSTVTPEPVKSTHLDDVRKQHPDLAEMVNSGVLLSWIQKQKPFMRPHLENIYYKGNTTQVVDLCSQFKESTGWKSQLTNQNSDDKKTKQEKLDAMKEVNSETGGAPTDGPDMNNFEQGAKDAGL